MRGGVKDSKGLQYYEYYDSKQEGVDEFSIREETVDFDFGIVKGKRQMHHFNGGAIFHVSLYATDDYILRAEYGTVIKSTFCLKGKRTSGIDTEGRIFELGAHHNNLYHFPPGTGYFDLKKGDELEYIDISMDDEFFDHIVRFYPGVFGEINTAILQNSFYQLAGKAIPTTLRMKAVINELLNCKSDMQLKKVYFIHKLIELMLLQFEQFKVQTALPKSATVSKTPNDYKMVEKAKQILIDRFAHPPTVIQLAREIGMNDYKLKKCFKEICGQTIMGYLTNYKMDLAWKLIQKKQNTVTEISIFLGYQSLSHFSKLFKRKYGFSPSDYKIIDK